MKLQKNDFQKNTFEVRNLVSVVEEKLSSIRNDRPMVDKLDIDELSDFYKILTMCELLLSKYENRKSTYHHMKKFVDILDSTIKSLEVVDGDIDELLVSADFSMKKIKEFESKYLYSKTDS